MKTYTAFLVLNPSLPTSHVSANDSYMIYPYALFYSIDHRSGDFCY